MDLAELAKNLYCKQCRAVLDLNHTEKEARVGLASVLYVACHCGVTNDVHTGAKQHQALDGRATYFVNMIASTSKSLLTAHLLLLLLATINMLIILPL